MRLRSAGLTDAGGGPSGGKARADAEPAAPRSGVRTWIGGVGYTHLRDFSAGLRVLERLDPLAREEGWPERIGLGDLSYDPVKIVHWLAAEDPPIERLVLISAVRRGHRPGTVTAYRWDQALPEPEQIQARVSEAVTGVIHLDNLLVVLGQFGDSPIEILVVEIEPDTEAMGEELTPAVARGTREAVELVRTIALDEGPELRTAPLGGFGGRNGRRIEAREGRGANPGLAPGGPP